MQPARKTLSKATHKKLRPKDRTLVNDFVSDEDFVEMLLAWFGNTSRVLKPGGSFYIWGGYANLGNYPPALKASGMYFAQAIVWDKQHPVLTRKDFLGAYELCFYGWKEGAGHHFYGPNNVQDLWHVKKVTQSKMVHLTEKPVELAVRAMQCSSKVGDSVLDLFGGSGSTLIGAERVAAAHNAESGKIGETELEASLPMRVAKVQGKRNIGDQEHPGICRGGWRQGVVGYQSSQMFLMCISSAVSSTACRASSAAPRVYSPNRLNTLID